MTSLQQQLRALAQKAPRVSQLKKVSILFTEAEASSLDVQAVFNIGSNGFLELCRMDERFTPFEQTLFSQASISYNRQMHTKEENRKLDVSIERFLIVISPYVLLKAAQKALEYLFRRFSLQIYNVEAVLRAVLPYHDTEVFCRIARILKVESTRWEWMDVTKKHANGIPRSLLVSESKRELSILQFLADAAKRSVEAKISSSKAIIGLYTAVTLEVISSQKVSDRLLQLLLPNLFDGLASSSSSDLQAASYMVVVQLAEFTSFTEELAGALLVALCASSRRSVEDTAMVLIHFCQMQRQLTTIPQEALEHLLELPHFFETLVDLLEEFSGDQFVSLLVKGLIDLLPLEQAFAAVRTVISEHDVSVLNVELLKGLITAYSADMRKRDNVKEPLQNQRRTLIRILEAKYPSQLDSVLDSMLGKEGAETNLLDALSSIVGSVRNQPLQSSGTTLFLSLSHASVHIRVSALSELAGQYAAKKADADFLEFYGSSLATALKDEKDTVVRTALSAPNLVGVMDAEELRSSLVTVITAGHSAPTTEAAMSVFFSKELRQVEGSQGGHGLLLLLQRSKSASSWKARSAALLEYGSTFTITTGIKSALKKVAAVSSSAEVRAANNVVFQHVGSKLARAADCPRELTQLMAAVEEASSLASASNLLDRHAISLVLLFAMQASKSQEDQLRLATALIDFIKPFLSALSQNLVPEQVKRVLEAPTSKRGEQDLGVALRCLDGLVEALPVVDDFAAISSTTWAAVSRPSADPFQRSMVDQVYFLLTKVYAVLTASPSYLALLPIYKKLLSGKHLSGARTLRFLSMFWFDEGASNVQDLLRVRALNFATAAISGHSDEELLQQLFPSLLCGLQDRSQPIRAASLHACTVIRQHIPQKSSKKRKSSGGADAALEIHGDHLAFSAAELRLPTATFVGLLDAILADKDAIVADCSHVSRALMQRLLSAGKAGDDLTAYVARHVQVVGHPRAKFLLLLSLATVKSAAVANLLATEFLELVKSGSSLGRSEERVAVLYLRHFNHSSAATLEDTAIQAFLAALAADHVVMEKATQSAGADVALADFAAEQISGGFFSKLPSTSSAAIFDAMLSMLRARFTGTRATALEAFSHFELPTQLVLAELETLGDNGGAGKGSKKRRRQSQEHRTDHAAVLDRLDSVLELVSSKKIRLQRESFFQLMKPLFKLVQVLIGQTDHPAAEEPTAEYTLQLVLHVLSKLVTLLLLLRTKEAPAVRDGDEEMREVDPKVDKRIEKENKVLAGFVNASVVVQCIRLSKSPQIHNKALLFLSSLASVFPEQVLENVMPVFTVMGATTMTQDDNYSFQVIQKIVQTIVPRIRHKKGSDSLLPVMRVFADALHRVPSHRRLLLYTVFMSSLSSQQYHCLLVMLLAKSTQSNHEPLPSGAETDVLGFCQSLCQRLPAAAVVEAFTRLIASLHAFAVAPDTEEVAALCQHMPVRVKHQATLQSAALTLIERSLTSREFVAQVLRLSAADEKRLQSQLVQLFLASMKLVQALAVLQNTGAHDAERGTTDLNTSFARRTELLCNVVDATNDLMETEQFTQCITMQLSHADAQLRRRALLILNDKIESLGQEHRDEEVDRYFVGMVAPIVDMLAAAASLPGSSTLNQQTAMYSLEILARHFASVSPEPFLDALPLLVRYLGLSSASPQLLASTVICVATYCMHLGPKIMGHLPVVYPKIIELLASTLSTTVSKKSKVQAREGSLQGLDDPASLVLLQLSCLSAVEVATKSLAQFTGPYLPSLLEALLHPELAASEKTQVRSKVASVIELLTEKVETRLLLPAVIASYKRAFALGEAALCSLFKLLAGVCRSMPRKQISDHYTKLFKFFAFAFDFRHQAQKKKRKLLSAEELGKLVEVVEKKLLHAFKAFVMRLDEQLFKPLFFKIIDWAYQAEPALYATRVTFLYRLIERLCSHLKGIFVPYFAYVLDHVVGILKEPESILKSDKLSKTAAKTLPDEALMFGIQALTRCFEHDTEQFVSKERFSTVVPPLVNVLENRSSSPRFGELVKALVLCLGALVESLTNDKLWKPLQHLVLLKTRCEEKRTRRAALLVLREFYARQKEDFLVVLPEAIPYIAELLEDNDEEVEGLCQDTVAEIDELLGEEKIEDYL